MVEMIITIAYTKLNFVLYHNSDINFMGLLIVSMTYWGLHESRPNLSLIFSLISRYYSYFLTSIPCLLSYLFFFF
jgi:hypothetical protein